MNPLVSIIIPNYNRANLIGETLDSVLAQTYTNWECIIVDDGSTDNSKEVIQSYVEKDIRFQLHERPADRPKGANACRNYGFELSKGEYINWFDSDDLMMPEKLEIQIKELHNSDYDYTICQTKMVDIDKNKDMGLRAPELKSGNTFEDYILFKVFWLTGAPLWKKSFILNNKFVFDERLQQSQDYDFHMRVLAISENYLTNNKPLVIFRYHSDNMSNSTFDRIDKIYSNIMVKNNILRYYNDKLGFDTKKKIYKQIIIFYSQSLRMKKLKTALYAYRVLYSNIDKVGYNTFNRLKILGRILLYFPTYLVLARGSFLLDFDYSES